MYDELVKSLRVCGKALEDAVYPDWDVSLYTRAADAIESMSEAYDKLSRHMDDLAALMPRWIPVSERLPEDLQNVLVIDDGRVTIGHCEHFYGDEQIYVDWHDTLYYPIDPPYWMPLPEPPEEET